MPAVVWPFGSEIPLWMQVLAVPLFMAIISVAIMVGASVGGAIQAYRARSRARVPTATVDVAEGRKAA